MGTSDPTPTFIKPGVGDWPHADTAKIAIHAVSATAICMGSSA